MDIKAEVGVERLTRVPLVNLHRFMGSDERRRASNSSYEPTTYFVGSLLST